MTSVCTILAVPAAGCNSQRLCDVRYSMLDRKLRPTQRQTATPLIVQIHRDEDGS